MPAASSQPGAWPTGARDVPFTTAPERAAVWLEPELLAEISYSELMEGWLRDPMYRGLIAR